MGKKAKKSTSFRVDPNVLQALSAKADGLSSRTGRTYSVATLVDTLLANGVEQSDDQILAQIARHQFGMEVVQLPQQGRLGTLTDRLRRMTTGEGADLPPVLSKEWHRLARDIPITGLQHPDLTYGLHLAIQQMKQAPNDVQRTLDSYVSEHGVNQFVQLLYRFLELARGGREEHNLLEDIQLYYLCVGAFVHPEIRPHIDAILAQWKERGDLIGVELVRQLLEAGEAVASRSKRQ